MNVEQLKKNIGCALRIRPIARRVDSYTRLALPPLDDDWYLGEVKRGRVVLHNPRTGHIASLGNDEVREYRTSGHLRLATQLTLMGSQVLKEPVWGP